jgi:hypothetical protein
VTIKNGVTTIDTDTGGASGDATLATGANTITVEVETLTETATYTVIVTKT